MTPDPSAVLDLDASLSSKNMGVVAHYYMDAELQVRSVLYDDRVGWYTKCSLKGESSLVRRGSVRRPVSSWGVGAPQH